MIISVEIMRHVDHHSNGVALHAVVWPQPAHTLSALSDERADAHCTIYITKYVLHSTVSYISTVLHCALLCSKPCTKYYLHFTALHICTRTAAHCIRGTQFHTIERKWTHASTQVNRKPWGRHIFIAWVSTRCRAKMGNDVNSAHQRFEPIFFILPGVDKEKIYNYNLCLKD